ncbi:MAG: hypothetical protein U0X91_23395 [Spirosomataceae bacterium]
MKLIVHSYIGIILLSSLSVMAQRSSIDSPHNYKRPESQRTAQNRHQTEATMVVNERIVPLELQNNRMSAHNYKRQGSRSFRQEATVVRNVPVAGSHPQNPLLMPGHYKSQFNAKPVEVRVARRKEQPDTFNDTLSR